MFLQNLLQPFQLQILKDDKLGQLDRDWYHQKDQIKQPEQALTTQEKQQLEQLLTPLKKPFIITFVHLISAGLFFIVAALS